MPLITVSEREFLDLIVHKQMASESRIPVANELLKALFPVRKACKLNAAQFGLLGYIVTRTLTEGRLAQRITVQEFMTACHMARNTARDHLTVLSDIGLINIYRTQSARKAHEMEARMFEIDCNFFMRAGTEGVENTGFLGQTRGGQKLTSPLPNLTPPSYISHTYPSGIHNSLMQKHSFCSPLDSSRTVAGGSSTQGVGNVIAIPKKTRAIVAPIESISEVLAKAKAESTATQARRVSSAGAKLPHQIEKLELQALLDKALKTYMPSATRVIVTDKAFGALRKRLREAPPADFPKFINWMIGQWSAITHQNRLAYRKRAGEDGAARGTPLPAAPDFTTIAYRYPYFLKVHTNVLAESVEVDATKAVTDKRVESMARQLAQAKRDQEALRQQLVKARTPLITPRAPVLRRTRPEPTLQLIANSADLDFADLPSWDENQSARKGSIRGSL